jgi:hypothetical protein
MSATDRRSNAGKRLYACDGPDCGLTHEPWGEGWVYFGAIESIDGESPLTFCSWQCAKARADSIGDVDAPTPNDVKSEMGKTLQRIIDGPMKSQQSF